MTEIQKISYDIASYVTHQHKDDIRGLRVFIEKTIKDSGIDSVEQADSTHKADEGFKECGTCGAIHDNVYCC